MHQGSHMKKVYLIKENHTGYVSILKAYLNEERAEAFKKSMNRNSNLVWMQEVELDYEDSDFILNSYTIIQ